MLFSNRKNTYFCAFSNQKYAYFVYFSNLF